MTDTAAPRTRLRIAHRLLRARDWQDRPELDRLADWWRRGAAGVCALVGIGGAGKTAIADRFLRRLPEVLPAEPGVDKDPSLPAPRELLVFSFYDAPNPDAFVAELAAWCGGTSGRARAPSYEETVRMLTDAEDLLLVLDGMERVQETGVRGPFGQITDGRLRDFVLRLAEGWLPGVRVIVTTRFRLFDPLAADSPLHFPIPVEKLAEATAVALLRQRGVCRGTDDQLRAIARGQGCHALSVDLIGGYLARFCGGDPARLPPEPPAPAAEDEPAIDPEEAAIREQEHKFARLAERYHEALARTDPAALALLQRVCLFRLGVDIGTLASIFTGGRKRKISGSGWALARLSEQQLRGRLDLLVEMKLLECSERKDDGSVVELYTVHPAVRDGFLRRLDDETARRGHDAAREGLETSLGGDPGRYPSDPATLDLLEEIVHHTLEAGHVNEAWDIYCDRIGGYKNLGWRLGAYERGERICRAFAGGRPSETGPLPEGLPENDQANFVNEWALYLNELGRLDAAVRCCERVNDLSLKKEDWENASRGNLNLTEVLFRAGRLAAGLRAAEEALQLAERADDAEERSNSHAYRGHARALRGETDAAPADFRDALHWQQEHEGKSERPLYSNRGFWHTLLLARLGQNEEATRLTEANKEILRNSWGEQHQHICRCNLVLTDLARERADLDAARELLAAAHDWAIARDAKEPLCWAAVVRAKIALNELRGPTPEQALKAARDAIEDGLRIARDCGYGIYHIDLLLLRAQVALCEGRADDAERDVRVALEEGVRPAVDSGLPALLAATDPECGYAWGEAEGRQLLAEAQLAQAAQILGSDTWSPRSPTTPAEVRELVASARSQLERCVRLRERIRDPKRTDAEALLAALERGELTRRPVVPRKETPPPRGPETMRDQVFISYSHQDADWLTKLQTALKPLVRNQTITVWADTGIRAGQKWKREIEAALARAKVAVLLVSQNFLASDFIAEKELPPLLEAAEHDGLTIIWVPVTASLYEETEIAKYQAAHNPATPLDGLSEAEVNLAWVEIAKEIKAAMAS